jgi:hypothetical protein
MTTQQALTQVFRFTNIGNAQSFADRSNGCPVILHGDFPYYFVTTARAASVLNKAGYEYLEVAR